MSTTPHKPLVYIISAPSGSGKSTLVSKLMKLVPNLDFSVSYTTRAARGAEQDGKQYYFVSRDEFERMIERDEFLEHAEFNRNWYGTARRALEEAGNKGYDLLLDIDVQGAAQIKSKLPQSVSIFIMPPDRRTLERRLRERGEDAEEVIQSRLITASREIEQYDKYDYILINDQLEDSIERLKAIVCSERQRHSGEPLSVEQQKALATAEICRLSNIRSRVQPILASFALPTVSSGSA